VVLATDLRASASVVIAGLAARETTEISRFLNGTMRILWRNCRAGGAYSEGKGIVPGAVDMLQTSKRLQASENIISASKIKSKT